MSVQTASMKTPRELSTSGRAVRPIRRVRAVPARLAVALCAAALAACTPGASDPAPAPAGIDGAWRLSEGRGPDGPIPLVAGHPITLEIAGTQLGGTSACNSYGGDVAVAGASFVPGQLHSTLMGCEPAVMASEEAYHRALEAIDTAALEGDDLLLTGGGVELRFTPLAEGAP